MSTVGVLGLGKLGMPIAVAIANRGHKVIGWDINPERMEPKSWPFQEADYEGRTFELWRITADLTFSPPDVIVAECDLILVCVQTPHEPRYEGVTRLPPDRVDFDYSYLQAAVDELYQYGEMHGVHSTIVVCSTVLPGTIRRLFPLDTNIIYNPQWLAMGHALEGYLDPEFVLIGTRDGQQVAVLEEFYKTITDAPILVETYETAEAIKVLYNTYITAKVCWANTAMELCHKVGANVDRVSDAMALATRRITSPMYMRGGMGDGGYCHPRDCIALSYLARKLEMRFDWFEALMLAREQQAEFLCELVAQYARAGLPIAIYGMAFKADSNLTVGSASELCARILEEWGHRVKRCSLAPWEQKEPHVYLIGNSAEVWARAYYPKGSVIIDPWRIVPDKDGVEVIRVGGG